MDTKGKLIVLSRNKGVFMAVEVENKRDTLERMSNEMQMLPKGASAPRHPRQRDVR